MLFAVVSPRLMGGAALQPHAHASRLLAGLRARGGGIMCGVSRPNHHIALDHAYRSAALA